MEILGCLSISSSELKLLIGLFHAKTQVRFYILQILGVSRML